MNIDKLLDKLTPESAERLALIIVGKEVATAQTVVMNPVQSGSPDEVIGNLRTRVERLERVKQMGVVYKCAQDVYGRTIPGAGALLALYYSMATMPDGQQKVAIWATDTTSSAGYFVSPSELIPIA